MLLISTSQAMPLFFGIIIGFLFSLSIIVLWEVRRIRNSKSEKESNSIIEMRDDLLIGLLVLSAFAFGAFVTYVLSSIRI